MAATLASSRPECVSAITSTPCACSTEMTPRRARASSSATIALLISVSWFKSLRLPECCDQGSYRRPVPSRAILTHRGHVFQPRGLSSASAPRTETLCQRSTTERDRGKYVTTKQIASNQHSTKSVGAGIDSEQAMNEEQLVREHLPLVQYVVSEVAHRVPNHVSRSDLVSAGMLGLAQAARSFDPERGIAFDRFASTRIRGALLDELRGRDWASRSVRSRARGLQATQEELTNRLGRAPKPEEVARTLGIAPETVHKLVDDVHRATVLNYDSLVVEGDAESFIASNRRRTRGHAARPRAQGVPDGRGRRAARAAAPGRDRLLLRRAVDAGSRRRARRERVAHLAAARRSAAVAPRRRELATRARRRSGRAAPERTRRAPQGELLRRRRRRLRLPHAVGPRARSRPTRS